MRSRSIIVLLLAIWPYVVPVSGQTARCLDAADEAHHQLLYENKDAGVLMLELPRIASTQPYCHAHPYLYVVTEASRSSTTPEGKGTYSFDWNGPEARFVYSPVRQVIHNESIAPFREVIVETLHSVQFDPLEGQYDTDLFPTDLGSTKPTWTVSFTRGAFGGFKTQLAPGDDATFGSPNHLLIAITDLTLRRTSAQTSPEDLELRAQDVRVLAGGSQFRLTNVGSSPARFILIEF